MTELFLNLLHETKKIFTTPMCEVPTGLLTASVGLTIIITQSGLFEPVRNWLESKSKKLGELINCPLCMGFWCGILIYFFAGGLIIFALNSSIFSFFAWSIYKKYL